MDALSCAIAAVPLAAYFLVMGSLASSRRGVLVHGSAELAALGGALSGAVFVGPLSLFRPEAATAELGNLVWLLLLSFYWLWVALAVLLSRPSLLVLNRTAAELRPVMAEVIRQLDPSARWAGESVSLPKLGVELYIESFGWARNARLVGSGAPQDLEGWRRMASALDRALRVPAPEREPNSLFALALGGGLLLLSVVCLLADPVAVSASWQAVFAF